MKTLKQLFILVLIFLSFTLQSQIIHENNFNSSSNWDRGYSFNHKENFTYRNSGGFNNSGYIRVKVERNEHYGGSLRYKFSDNGKAEPKELYAQYKVYYESSMSLYSGKAPGFDGTRNVCGWGNCIADGRNGWSARGSINPNSSNKVPNRYYVYHKDMSLANGKTWGDTWNWGLNSTGLMNHNQWYTVEQYIKVNTVGRNNGILRAWVNDVLVFEKTNIRFTTTSNNNFDKVWAYWFNYYHGGSDESPQDAYIRIDDFKLSSSAITTLSVNNNKSDDLNKVKLYPNPTAKSITIDGVQNLTFVEIYDIAGKLVLKVKPNSLKTIDLSSLQRGIYFTKIHTKDNNFVVKVTKE